MPRRTLTPFPAGAKPPLAKKKRKVALVPRVARVARGTLLAVTLVATQIDGGKLAGQLRLFDAGLLDRLHTPLTRHPD